MNDILVRKFKDEAVAVYSIEGKLIIPSLKRYIVSTRDTRDLMNHPEIINCDFTNLMQNGVTNALKGINYLEKLSSINSKNVNVYHILRGGLNFNVRNALRKGFGYKWHSSSYISSQRILNKGKYEISEDYYRKFLIPDQATIYTADIVATGVSLHNSIEYVFNYMQTNNIQLRNMIIITIGCIEAENVLEKWHLKLKKVFTNYDRTIIIFLEGRFALANHITPLQNYSFHTDLLKNYKLNALLTPEYEHSQFDKINIALEACAIYDGGKKAFEPLNHIQEVLDFWTKQYKTAKSENLSLWEEYNARFPLDLYFKDITKLEIGSPSLLEKNKSKYWIGLEKNEYMKLFRKFSWLWNDALIRAAQENGSLKRVCEKKIKYLQSLIEQQ